MVNTLENVKSLKEFQQNSASCLKEVAANGEILFLQEDGEERFAILDIKSFDKLWDIVDQARAMIGIQKGLKAIEDGAVQHSL